MFYMYIHTNCFICICIKQFNTWDDQAVIDAEQIILFLRRREGQEKKTDLLRVQFYSMAFANLKKQLIHKLYGKHI